MIRSIIPMVLLGGLSLSGAALAVEPTPGTTHVMYSGMKVGIDAAGKLRPLTAAESRQLDLKMTGGQGRNFVTRQQARASQKKIVGGGTSMKLPSDQLVTVTAMHHADGTVTLREDGVSKELPNE